MSPLRIVSLTIIVAACMVICACGRSNTPPRPEGSSAAAAGSTAHAQNRAANSRPAASTPKRGSACSFISSAEMAQLLDAPIGKSVADDSAGTTSCAYPPGEAGSYAQADIAIEWDHGDAPSFERQLVNAFGDSDVGRMVAHNVQLGDEASYSREGVLSIRAGKALVTITLPMRPDSEVKAIAVGKKLLEQLGAPTASASVSAPPSASAPASVSAPPPFPDGLSVGEECPEATGEPVQVESALVPLKVGLTLSHTWTGRAGDYDHECLVQVMAATASYVDVTESCPVGQDHHNFTGKRRLCRGDLRDSYFYRTETTAVVPPVVSPATMFSLSTRSFRELKSAGSTRHRYIEIADAWRTNAQPMHEDTDGTLRLKRSDREPYKVIVNDRPVELPTIVATSNTDTPKMTIARILDDERFPLVLDYQVPGDGFRIQYVKISYPADGELEKHLAVDKHVDVYGIYFDFASDRLRPESTPVLAEIANVLAKNADWKLTINGHTDNVGGDASNLELSRRRAQSVKEALVGRYGIAASRLTTGGFGASQPQATNDTLEGRGRNRRVELMRQ